MPRFKAIKSHYNMQLCHTRGKQAVQLRQRAGGVDAHLFVRRLLCQCSVAEQQERLIKARHLNQQHQLGFQRVYVVRR